MSQQSADRPRLRPAIAAIPAYKAGRAGTAASGAPAYKLSSNENPYPPLPGVAEAAAQAVAEMHRYPDFASSALLDELSAQFDVPVDHIAVGTGSVGVAQQLMQASAGPGDEIVYAWRSFEAYPILTRIVGASAVEVPLRDERHDLEAMADAITERTRLVLVCNPNNPTGTSVRRAGLEAFLERVPEDVLVVLDEAYREFITDPDVPDGIDLYRDRPNVCVLRTFSKAYGLAGMRVGFAFAHPPVAAALRACAVPFGVSSVAQVAAVASLRARPALDERVAALVEERARVVGKARALGLSVPQTDANFYWLRLGRDTPRFAAACEEAGATVRPFGDEGARITIGEREANDLVLDVAARFV
jgi:histidinol-phosphate aminotransferase